MGFSSLVRLTLRQCVMYDAGNTFSSLALDSSRELLYFTDPGSGKLGVLSTAGFGGSPSLLIVGANEKPRGIAVDSTNRYFMLISTSYVLTLCTYSYFAVELTLIDDDVYHDNDDIDNNSNDDRP